MELPIPILQTTSLFHGMTEEEIRHLIRCLATPVRRYGKGAFIWHAGETITHAGIVLSGTVDAVQYHDDGTVQLVARQTAGGVFGDLLMASGQPSPVSLLTTDGAEVLFLPLDDILTDCGNRCPFHIQLRHNLLQEAADKYWQLHRRLQYMSEPSLRGRILLYLRDQRQANRSDYFTIPYSREDLAQFLGVNRSALSRELGRLQKEGIIDYHRNSFRILQ